MNSNRGVEIILTRQRERTSFLEKKNLQPDGSSVFRGQKA